MDKKFKITKEKIKRAKALGLIDDKMEKILEGYVAPPELYIPVSARLRYFHSCNKYKNWSIETHIRDRSNGLIEARCVIRDPNGVIKASGTSVKNYIKDSSSVEIAETAAVGRALALLGIVASTNIASMEEMEAEIVVEAAPKEAEPLKLPKGIKTDSVNHKRDESKKEEKVSLPDVLNILKKLKIGKDRYSAREVGGNHVIVIKNPASLSDEDREVLDKIGFKNTRGVYKILVKEKE